MEQVGEKLFFHLHFRLKGCSKALEEFQTLEDVFLGFGKK
jgi:hypothetical protein